MSKLSRQYSPKMSKYPKNSKHKYGDFQHIKNVYTVKNIVKIKAPMK